jgi:hypothetical protein
MYYINLLPIALLTHNILGGNPIDSNIIGNNIIDITTKYAIIEPNSRIVIDGHNMIHSIKSIDNNVFDDNLHYISQIISDSLPGYDLHIVIKNPNDQILNNNESFAKLTRKQMLRQYFMKLVEMGKKFPNITYHLAQGNEPKTNEPKTNKNHYLKGRDDFLSIYLAKDQYVVSQDKYKDFSSFSNIKPFYHLSTKAGEIFKKQRIDPAAYFSQINKPTLGSHLTYEFITKEQSKKQNIKSGDIIIDTPGILTKLYLVMY